MRILLSCLQGRRGHRIAPYQFWREYFVQGLTEAGHEVMEVPDVDWAEGMAYPEGAELIAWRARAWERTLNFARKEQAGGPADLFLGYLFPKQIETGAVRELQRIMPAVNFFCDNVREFRHLPGEFAPFTLHWVPEYAALPLYRNARLPFLHAPMACWIRPELRTQPDGESEPATFLGSADSLRIDVLGRALQAGAEFQVRGPGWGGAPEAQPASQRAERRISGGLLSNQMDVVRRFGVAGLITKVYTRLRPLTPRAIDPQHVSATLWGDEYVRVTREARVTLGVNRAESPMHTPRRPLVYSRLRDIEAPMFGACYLTEWAPDIPHLYEAGTEVETWRDAMELKDKLSALLMDPVRRGTMRRLAQARALNDHSIPRTIEKISERLGLRSRNAA